MTGYGVRGISYMLAAALMAATSSVSITVAQAQQQTAQRNFTFNIPAKPVPQAVNDIGRVTGLSVVFRENQAITASGKAVRGSMTAEQALSTLLAGTGLTYRFSNASTVQVFDPSASATNGAAVEDDDSTVLETITVQGTGSATEGTGSYATNLPTATATPLGLSLKETPQSVSVMTKQRTDDQALTTVREVLQQTPGVNIADLGNARYSLMSRGYGVRTYQIDGVNTELDIQTTNNPQAQGDMIIYDRIEMLRGAAGLTTGAGDPSGTINLVRKKPTSTFQGYVSGTVGSWDKYRTEADVSGPLNAAGTIRGRLVGAVLGANSFIDYDKQDGGIVYGVVEADVTENTLVTIGADHQRKNHDGSNYNLGFPLFFSDGSQTDFPRSFSTASRDAYNNVTTTNSFISVEHNFDNNWKLNAKANYLVSELDSHVLDFVTSNNLPSVTGDGLRLRARDAVNKQSQFSADINIQGKFELFGREHDLVLGGSYLESKTRNDRWDDTSGLNNSAINIFTWDRTGGPVSGQQTLYEDYHSTQVAAYGAARFAITDSLKTIVGARLFNYDKSYEWYNYNYDGGVTTTVFGNRNQAKKNGILTPYFGVTYDLNENHTVYGSVASIYRPQTSRDRNGAYLDPLEGINYEVGLKSEFLDGRLHTNVAAYQIRQDNLAEADTGYTVPGTSSAAYRAVKGAVTSGFEIEANGEIRHGWNLAASYTYSQTEDADGDRINTTYPEHMIKLWTTYRLPGDWDKLTIGAGLTWQSDVYVTTTPWYVGREITARQNSFAVVNLMAKYDFNENVTATLNINNLFDEKYLTSIDSTFLTGYYGAPRNFTFDLKYKF